MPSSLARIHALGSTGIAYSNLFGQNYRAVLDFGAARKTHSLPGRKASATKTGRTDRRFRQVRSLRSLPGIRSG